MGLESVREVFFGYVVVHCSRWSFPERIRWRGWVRLVCSLETRVEVEHTSRQLRLRIDENGLRLHRGFPRAVSSAHELYHDRRFRDCAT